jgi:hypothetical protein
METSSSSTDSAMDCARRAVLMAAAAVTITVDLP